MVPIKPIIPIKPIVPIKPIIIVPIEPIVCILVMVFIDTSFIDLCRVAPICHGIVTRIHSSRIR